MCERLGPHLAPNDGLAVAEKPRLCPANLWYRGDAASAWKVVLTLVAVDRRRPDEPAVWHAFAFSLVYLSSTFAAYLVRKNRFHAPMDGLLEQAEKWDGHANA